LARAHSLLTEDSWRGASLKDIVMTALSAFVDEGRTIDIGGDAVMVPAGATVTLSLMLHELATNAAKYGALSVAEGRLSVRWIAAETGASVVVDLRWREDGGPPVSPPTRRSFGSRLLASSAKQLGAELELDYAPPGLRCRLRFPVPRPG
jgi:two-component sensor histidine kinase